MAQPPPSTQDPLCLVEFSHKHLDFQLAELSSILEMNGIRLIMPTDNGGDNDQTSPSTSRHMACCRMLPLPSEERYQQEENAASRRPFVILSCHFPDIPPQQSNIDDTAKSYNTENGLDRIASALSRCTLVRRVLELWGVPGLTLEECAQNAHRWIQQTQLGKDTFGKVSQTDQSWKVSIHTLGAKYSREEQDVMRKQLACFLDDIKGPVQMKGPSNEYLLIRETELDTQGGPLYPRHSHLGKKQVILEHDQRPALAWYFGRILMVRPRMDSYDLKLRRYLGPTSMDAELSFLMTNLAHLQQSSVVLDPFVGTGSILVSCALRGAYCVGTDIDIRVLRGRNADENVYSNFKQFQLPRPELIRSDNSIYHRHFRTNNTLPLYDAIVCDPPYGIRAGARQSGTKLEQVRPILDEHRHDHIAQTKPYNVSDVMADLLDVAARTLVMGGRLVYVIPSFAKDFNPKDDLPQHECLAMLHSCYQPFTPDLGRRIVTMKKMKDYDPLLRETYLAKTWKNGPESAEKCANIRDKIIEAAKLKPGYEEKAKIRKQKRQETKRARKMAKLERGKQRTGHE